jgi:hypothetical protein
MQEEYLVQRTLNTYSNAASRGDWDRTIGTYMPNGIWEIPHLSLRFEGHKSIREALENFKATMDYVIQMNAPALIEIDGTNATAHAAIRECGKSKGKNEGFEFFGFYADELIRTAEGWKFVRRVFQGVGSSRFPLISGESH